MQLPTPPRYWPNTGIKIVGINILLCRRNTALVYSVLIYDSFWMVESQTKVGTRVCSFGGCSLWLTDGYLFFFLSVVLLYMCVTNYLLIRPPELSVT